MPRIRTLKPEHRQHRKTGALDHLTYRLWVGMILEADDAGRLVADPAQLRSQIFSYHPRVSLPRISTSLRALHVKKLCRLYVVNNIQYAWFPSWLDHQKINKPRPSILPQHPADRTTPGRLPDDSRTAPGTLPDHSRGIEIGKERIKSSTPLPPVDNSSRGASPPPARLEGAVAADLPPAITTLLHGTDDLWEKLRTSGPAVTPTPLTTLPPPALPYQP